MYKMVALDLDDTLLAEDNQISRENAGVIFRVLEKGVIVCLISGRSYSSMKKYNDSLKLRHLTGSLNGACIIEACGGRLLYSSCLEKAFGRELVKRLEEYGVHINFYHGHKVICRERNRFSERYEREIGAEIEYVGPLSDYSASAEAGKLLLMDESEKLEKIRHELLMHYGSRINITYSKPDYLEIYRKDVSKGEAVKKIAGFYGLSSDEIIAIGDGENDISMLRYAGAGVAMGNASAKVKECADFVTYSNNENGVAYALEKLLLSGAGRGAYRMERTGREV